MQNTVDPFSSDIEKLIRSKIISEIIRYLKAQGVLISKEYKLMLQILEDSKDEKLLSFEQYNKILSKLKSFKNKEMSNKKDYLFFLSFVKNLKEENILSEDESKVFLQIIKKFKKEKILSKEGSIILPLLARLKNRKSLSQKKCELILQALKQYSLPDEEYALISHILLKFKKDESKVKGSILDKETTIIQFIILEELRKLHDVGELPVEKYNYITNNIKNLDNYGKRIITMEQKNIQDILTNIRTAMDASTQEPTINPQKYENTSDTLSLKQIEDTWFYEESSSIDKYDKSFYRNLIFNLQKFIDHPTAKKEYKSFDYSKNNYMITIPKKLAYIQFPKEIIEYCIKTNLHLILKKIKNEASAINVVSNVDQTYLPILFIKNPYQFLYYLDKIPKNILEDIKNLEQMPKKMLPIIHSDILIKKIILKKLNLKITFINENPEIVEYSNNLMQLIYSHVELRIYCGINLLQTLKEFFNTQDPYHGNIKSLEQFAKLVQHIRELVEILKICIRYTHFTGFFQKETASAYLSDFINFFLNIPNNVFPTQKPISHSQSLDFKILYLLLVSKQYSKAYIQQFIFASMLNLYQILANATSTEEVNQLYKELRRPVLGTHTYINRVICLIYAYVNFLECLNKSHLQYIFTIPFTSQTFAQLALRKYLSYSNINREFPKLVTKRLYKNFKERYESFKNTFLKKSPDALIGKKLLDWIFRELEKVPFSITITLSRKHREYQIRNLLHSLDHPNSQVILPMEWQQSDLDNKDIILHFKSTKHILWEFLQRIYTTCLSKVTDKPKIEYFFEKNLQISDVIHMNSLSSSEKTEKMQTIIQNLEQPSNLLEFLSYLLMYIEYSSHFTHYYRVILILDKFMTLINQQFHLSLNTQELKRNLNIYKSHMQKSITITSLPKISNKDQKQGSQKAQKQKNLDKKNQVKGTIFFRNRKLLARNALKKLMHVSTGYPS